jgi:beta-glucosidase
MDLITGAANPSGKLPITFPKRMVDTPAYTSYPGEFGKVYYGEGLFVGYRWYDARHIEPLLPFGFGLSYTRFEFSDLALIAEQDLVKVRCRVTNVGERAGKETVQVYVEPVSPDVARPVKELKAFAKVDLAPGESTDVEIELDHAAFAYWNIDHGDWFVSGGEYLVLVGNSSRDIHLSASFERQSPEMKKAEKTRPF